MRQSNIAIGLSMLLIMIIFIPDSQGHCKSANSSIPGLIKAAKVNDFNKVKDILDRGQSPDLLDPEGYGAIHWAAAGGYVEILRLLLEKGADMDLRTPLGYTPLFYALRHNRSDAAKELLKRNADVKTPGLSGLDPLILACYFGRMKIAEEIIHRGADPLRKVGSGVTILTAVSGSAKPEMAEFLVSRGVDINQGSKDGITALMEASYRGNAKLVDWLLANGAKVNRADEFGRTALHYACLSGYGPVVAKLLEAKADKSLRDELIGTPLDCAKKAGHEKIAQALKTSDASGLKGKDSGPWPQWLAEKDKNDPDDDKRGWDIEIEAPGEKVAQLTNEYDRELEDFTANRTLSRYKLKATDLGAPFEHNNKIFILFGDTSGANRGDAIAYTTDKDPSDGVGLKFVTDEKGVYSPVRIPGITQGGFEVPMEGVSANGRMYIYHTTGRTKRVKMGRSTVASSDDNGATFKYLYDLSYRRFINVSVVKVKCSDWQGLPKESGTGLLLFGSGRYRESNVRLAFQPVESIEDPSTIRYLTGFTEQGAPRWGANEADSVELFGRPCVGELSVSYNRFIKKWIMLYNCRDKISIIKIRTANEPWGPWSRQKDLYNPKINNGFCNILHRSVKKQRCDKLEDPGKAMVNGDTYGPYQYESLSQGWDGRTTIYFNVSTWNPYTVVLMKAKLKIN